MADSEQMQPLFSQSLRKCVSVARLDAYGIGADTEFERLLRYSWNLKLCESLYTPLQNFEVSLRNTIDVECKNGLKMPNWTSHTCMAPIERVAIQEAKDSLVKGGKSISHSGIVSELKFSFWTSLFRSVYEQTLFRPALVNVFRHAPHSLRQRKAISSRLDSIRGLRNRVFHHEPIWNKKDIQAKHGEIIEALSWIDPKMHSYTKWLDTFDEVYSKGVGQFDKEQLVALACESVSPVPSATP